MSGKLLINERHVPRTEQDLRHSVRTRGARSASSCSSHLVRAISAGGDRITKNENLGGHAHGALIALAMKSGRVQNFCGKTGRPPRT